MQDQLEMLNEIIYTFLQNGKEGKKALMEWFLNDVMNEEVKIQVSALPYERTDTGKAHRNGTRNRTLKAAEGELNLNKSQIREFPFETKVFERYSRVEKAIETTMFESYLYGVSTRNVRHVVESLGLKNVSASYYHLWHQNWMLKLRSS